MKNVITIIALTLLTNLTVRANTDDGTKIYSLRDCMEYAVSNSTQMRIQQATMGDERIARRDAILNAFTPYVSANAYAYGNFGRSVDPETNTYISTTSFNNGYSVSASIPLFNGFEAVNNMKINKTAVAMGISEEERIKNNICLSTMEAYCNVVYYSHLVKILDEQVNTVKENLRVTRMQEELGQKGYADVVEMKAALAEQEYNRVTAENNRKNALLTLMDVMFWPLDEELEIDLDFGDGTGSEAGGGTEGAGPDSTAGEGYGSARFADERSIIDNALNFLPEVRVAKGTMDNAKLELRTAKWQLLPSLTLYGGWSTSYFTYPGMTDYVPTPFWDQFRNNGGEYVQLSLSIPIFGRLERQSNISRKKNAFKRAEAQYEQKVHEVEAEVIRAIQDCEGAEAAWLSAERRSEVQEEAYRLNLRKLEQGLISTIEYRTASESYLNAATEALNKRLQLSIKTAVVAYYNGIPYLDQNL